jgi:hypothetical protein
MYCIYIYHYTTYDKKVLLLPKLAAFLRFLMESTNSVSCALHRQFNALSPSNKSLKEYEYPFFGDETEVGGDLTPDDNDISDDSSFNHNDYDRNSMGYSDVEEGICIILNNKPTLKTVNI